MFTLAAHSPLQLLLDLPDNYIYVLLKLHCPLKKNPLCPSNTFHICMDMVPPTGA